jgi:hypothetical protein
MANAIKYDVKTKTVTITFDLDPQGKYPVTASGKSFSIFTTGGNKAFFKEFPKVKIGLNCFVANPDYVEPEGEAAVFGKKTVKK